MMRRRFTAIALGVTLGCSAASLILPGVSQATTTDCPATLAPGLATATIPPELTLLLRKIKHVLHSHNSRSRRALSHWEQRASAENK